MIKTFFHLGRKPLLILSALALISVLFVVLGGMDKLSFASFQTHFALFHAWITLHPLLSNLVFILLTAVILGMGLPLGTIFPLVAGIFWGWGHAFVLVYSGVLLAASGFYHWVNPKEYSAHHHIHPNKFATLRQLFKQHRWLVLIGIRIVPVFPFVVGNLLQILWRVPFRHFIISTAIGVSVPLLAYSWVGTQIHPLLTVSGQNWEDFIPNQLWLGLAIVGILVLLPILAKFAILLYKERARAGRGTQQPPTHQPHRD